MYAVIFSHAWTAVCPAAAGEFHKFQSKLYFMRRSLFLSAIGPLHIPTMGKKFPRGQTVLYYLHIEISFR